ncbi:MAG TPA: hypothetical protein VNR38_01015 [Ureibacillus sp.]|nr:hypothetical protein [Ureibacillus sp.]
MSRRLTTQEFIEKSKCVHGDKYNYDKVIYVMSNKKVIIHCYKHGDFEQTPNSHLCGRGCNECAKEITSTKLSGNNCLFIEKAKLKHGNKYDYKLVCYKNNRTKVKIICPIHDVFEQTPAHHLNGGCEKCGRSIINFKNKKSISDVIKDFKKIHGDRYDYSLVDYKKWNLNIKIKCNIHGVFEQTPNKHLNGNGCYKCGRDSISIKNRINSTTWGFSKWCDAAFKSKVFDSFKVYIIKCWNETETFYKIGRTYRLTKYRFNSKRDLPYNYEVVKELVFDKRAEMIDNAIDCFYKEIDLKRINKELKYTPMLFFKGMNECFSEINFDILN